jgi:hypothetical protein
MLVKDTFKKMYDPEVLKEINPARAKSKAQNSLMKKLNYGKVYPLW